MARFITTERGLDRVVNFSDATVAIALTLLILPLADLAGSTGDRGLGEMLAAHVGAVIAFLISFVVIAAMWRVHHRFFESLVDYDEILVRCNLVWLLAIVVLPFSTEGLNVTSHHADRVSVAVYIGNLLFGFATIGVMRAHAARHPEIVAADRRSEMRIAPDVTVVGLCAFALVVGLITPRFGLWALLLIPFGRTPVRALTSLRRSR